MAAGTPNFNTGDKNLSPEQQMNKLREQARSGGGGGGGRPKEKFGGSNVPITPQPENFPDFKQENVQDGIVLDLAPDANDKDMEELLGILQTKGFVEAMKALDRINNPHIEDDFHRLLVQYKKEGHAIPGIPKDSPYAKALDFVLLEVAVPESSASEPGGSLVDIASQMEQLYQSVIPFLSLPDPIFFKDWTKRKALYKDFFSMEIATAHSGEEAVFYMGVPRARRELFEKQIFSHFPKARVAEQKDDYNVFNQFGHTVVAYGTLFRPAVLPLRTAERFKQDPMNLMLSAFAKITREGEGAAIQIMVGNAGEYHMSRMKAVIKDLSAGKSASDVYRNHQYLGNRDYSRRALPEFAKGAKELFETKDKKKDESKPPADDVPVINKKLQTALTGVNIRIVASARTKERAEEILNELESSFGQFENLSEGNLFKFRRPSGKKETRELLRSFIFRTFDRGPIESLFTALVYQFTQEYKMPLMHKSPAMPLNLQEISALFHLTIAGGTSSRQARTSGAKQAPAYTGLPESGLLLGRNKFSNIETKIFMTPEDRLRHFYVIGQTGTGKTNFLKNMIVQDIENGEGVCFIDPHGVDVQEILSRVPKERYDDLIYFDPAYLPRPMGLNMLEYDPRAPEQKTFVVDEMFKIFQKLYGAVPEAFGPIFEQYFRNAAGLVVVDPETGSTLLDISRVLADEDYRHLKLSRSKNPVINHFWEDVAENVRGEGSLANVIPYITSKFDIFIANEIMRPIVGQQRSAFDMKDIMDNRKILLVNLSKGRLGDINANLIGLVLVGKIMMAALARAEYLHENPPPFYLYLDEFQNVTTDTVSTILSEARKYRLSLTIAHQFISQLSGDRIKEGIKNAVFGNVGSMATFRVGPDDSKFLETQFAPIISASDMMQVENYHAYVKMLANGKPFPVFSMETYPFRLGDFAQIDALKQLSYQRYGRPREAVEGEVQEKYNAMRGKL